MPSITGQAMVNAALTILGILEQGGTPSSSDSTDALAELNSFWDAWNVDEGLIFAQVEVSGASANGTAGYSVGSGGTINVTRIPGKIYKAHFGQSNNRNELRIIPAEVYYEHNDLTASAATPEELFPDFNVDPTTGLMKVYLWPVPSVISNIYLLIAVPVSNWALGTTYNIPPAYLDAIQYSLAFRLIPRFAGSVPQEIVQVVTSLAQKAEARLRQSTQTNRQVPPPGATNPEAQQAMEAQQKG